ncbi:MAG: imidazole glycerol phosphate synthase subunit HisF [Gammaproteobacteria bacterium]
MLAKRIIPCLDVKDGKVVKGIRFRNHQIVGDIVELAERYCQEGADELVFYDITASSDQRTINRQWVRRVAEQLDIPFCVAGGIRTLADVEELLKAGADKISINSPALENPDIINKIAETFGKQCVVIGIDSLSMGDGYRVYQYTGDVAKTQPTLWQTPDWINEVQARGAGEIVLNCMNQDGVRQGYDIQQLKQMRTITNIPLIASGGAGSMQHFLDVFNESNVDGALAASVFHLQTINIAELKAFLFKNNVAIGRQNGIEY